MLKNEEEWLSVLLSTRLEVELIITVNPEAGEREIDEPMTMSPS